MVYWCAMTSAKPVVALICVLVAAALAAADARAGGEVLRWKLDPDGGIVFKVTGPDPKAVCDGAPDERTLYGADIAKDGRGLALPVGRPADLIWHYLYLLPEGAVDQGAQVPVDETLETPPFTIGPIRVQGE